MYKQYTYLFYFMFLEYIYVFVEGIMIWTHFCYSIWIVKKNDFRFIHKEHLNDLHCLKKSVQELNIIRNQISSVKINK